MVADPLLFLASLIASLYAVGYVYRLRRSRHLASPASLYAALAFIHFSMPGLLLGIGVGPDFVGASNRVYATEAILFVLAGLIAVQIGSLLASSQITAEIDLSEGKEPIVWRSSRLLWVTGLLLIVGWAARLHVIDSNAYFQILRTSQGNLEGPFFAAIRMIELFPMYVLCMFAIRYWRPNALPSRVWRFALHVAVILELLYWLPSGRKEPVVLAVLLPLFIRYVLTQKLPSKRSVVTLVLGIGLMFPATYYYRTAMGSAEGSIDIVETVITASTAVGSGGTEIGKPPMEVIAGRISLLEPLSACIRLWRDGDWEPMLGQSYAQALLSLVPRVIWGGKPNLHYGTEFGHAAGYLSNDDWETSISVTYFGEAFLNFGWAGLWPLFVIGLLFGTIYRRAKSSYCGETWLLVYAVMLPTILYIGGTFALHFGGLIKLLPFFFLVGWMMNSRPTRHSAVGGQLVTKT